MSESELLRHLDGHVLTLTINREQRRNALSASVTRELVEVLTEAERSAEVRVVCITAAGDKAFCAGGDLAADMSAGEGAEPAVRAFEELVMTMDSMGTPIVARVNGHCMGGGLGLVLACDMALACDEAKFGTPEVRAGMFPMIISPLVIAHAGRKQGMEMLLAGRKVDAAEALSLGFINRVVSRPGLDSATEEMINDVLAGSPSAIRMGKRAIARTRFKSPAEVAHELGDALLEVVATEDAMEGINAFFEKRTPRWKGR